MLITMMIGISMTSYAQDNNTDAHDINITVPEVALLDIEPSANTTIALEPTAPTEAGNPLDFSTATNNLLWMNYSSIIGSTTEPTRNATVSITNGSIPAGTQIQVVAAADAGNGGGNVGTPTAAITLSSTAQQIVTGVESCYTGSGVNDGHNLTYTMSLTAPSDYGSLDFDQSTTITVTYTLSDN